MTHPDSLPSRTARRVNLAVASALPVGGLMLLSATLALAAPAETPGPAAAKPRVERSESCPIPGRVTAADGSLRGFVPATHFYLEVDGKEVPAELYHIDTTAILVISRTLPSPLLLKAETVVAVPPAKIEKKPDGTVDVRQDAVLQPLGAFRATYDVVSFEIGGHRQALRPRPPLDFLRPPNSPSPHGPR